MPASGKGAKNMYFLNTLKTICSFKLKRKKKLSTVGQMNCATLFFPHKLKRYVLSSLKCIV